VVPPEVIVVGDATNVRAGATAVGVEPPLGGETVPPLPLAGVVDGVEPVAVFVVVGVAELDVVGAVLFDPTSIPVDLSRVSFVPASLFPTNALALFSG